MTTGIDHACTLFHKITQEGPIRHATVRLDECLVKYPIKSKKKARNEEK
jgi:hypothetical protein